MMGKTTFQGLALCEGAALLPLSGRLLMLAWATVIDYKKDGKPQYKASPYYVIPEETHVVTRFFYAFPSGSVPCPLCFVALKCLIGDVADRVRTWWRWTCASSLKSSWLGIARPRKVGAVRVCVWLLWR
jgi:hypothetical protein